MSFNFLRIHFDSNSDILGVRERIIGGVGGVTEATSWWRQMSGRRDAHPALRRPPSGSQVSSGLQLLLVVSSGQSLLASEERCQARGTRIKLPSQSHLPPLFYGLFKSFR